MKQKKVIKYKAYSFRMMEGTYQLMREQRERSRKSWNRFIYSLLQQNEDLYK